MNLTKAQIELCIKWVEHNALRTKLDTISDKSQEFSDAVDLGWELYTLIHGERKHPWINGWEGITREKWIPVHRYLTKLLKSIQ